MFNLTICLEATSPSIIIGNERKQTYNTCEIVTLDHSIAELSDPTNQHQKMCILLNR